MVGTVVGAVVSAVVGDVVVITVVVVGIVVVAVVVTETAVVVTGAAVVVAVVACVAAAVVVVTGNVTSVSETLLSSGRIAILLSMKVAAVEVKYPFAPAVSTRAYALVLFAVLNFVPLPPTSFVQPVKTPPAVVTCAVLKLRSGAV